MAERKHTKRSHVVVRDSPLGPQALVLGTGLRVWELVKACRALGESSTATAAYFAIDGDLVDEALAYARTHPTETEAAIDRQESVTLESLKAMLPDLEVFEAEAGEPL